MGLNIKNAAVESAIRELAARTGESLTDAIQSAVREKLTRLAQKDAAERPAETLEEFLAWLKPLQDDFAERRRQRGDRRTLQEMMDELYDESGLPT